MQMLPEMQYQNPLFNLILDSFVLLAIFLLARTKIAFILCVHI